MSDPAGRFSTGIPDFDRLLGGGFPRGSLALVHLDPSVAPEDRDLLLLPIYLNFLYQSRGILAVLPARDAPRAFRARLTPFVTRRRFDLRVRVVEYVGEDDDAPFVVSLAGVGKATAEKGKRPAALEKMARAERAVRGARARPFLEVNALEIAEVLFGAELAARMFFHGVKRARSVGNLVVGLLRPGLAVEESVRSMADTELDLRRDELGLVLRGLRPKFSGHLVTVDERAGRPHVAFIPRARPGEG